MERTRHNMHLACPCQYNGSGGRKSAWVIGRTENSHAKQTSSSVPTPTLWRTGRPSPPLAASARDTWTLRSDLKWSKRFRSAQNRLKSIVNGGGLGLTLSYFADNQISRGRIGT